MRKLLKQGLWLCVLVTLWLPVYAQTTYYLSNQGNDANDGISSATAWQTLNRINQAIQERTITLGDTILFQRGHSFVGTIAANRIRGDDTLGVTFGAFGDGDRPILSGSIPLSGWNATTANGVSTCQVDISGVLNNIADTTSSGGAVFDDIVAGRYEHAPQQVLWNSQFQYLARYPDIDVNTPTNSFLFVNDEAQTGSTMKDDDLSSVPQRNQWVGGTVVYRQINWSYKYGNVLSINSSSMKLDENMVGNFGGENGYFFQGKLVGLSAPNEWIIDNNTLYFIPTSGTSCQQLDGTVLVSVFKNAVSLNSLDRFENIKVFGYSAAGVALGHQDTDITVQNSEFSHSGDGISGTSNSDVLIHNNYIHDIADTGISINSPLRITVTDNVIEYIGLYPGFAAGMYNGITMQANTATDYHSNVIRGNRISYIGYSGIMYRVGNTRDEYASYIENNVIEHVLQTLVDGGAIYMQDTRNTIIRNNIIRHGLGSKTSWKLGRGFFDYTNFAFGLVMYEDTCIDNQIIGNTVYDFDVGYLHEYLGTGTVIKNNLFYGNRVQQMRISLGDKTSGSLNYDVQNNIFFMTNSKQLILKKKRNTSNTSNWNFGTFNNNFFGTPYSYDSRAFDPTDDSNKVITSANFWRGDFYYSLPMFKLETGQEANSQESSQKWTTITLDGVQYEIDQIVGDNLIANGDFEAGLGVWEPSNKANLKQETKTGLDGMALRLDNTNETFYVRVNNGASLPLQMGQYYLLRFSVIRDKQLDFIVGIAQREGTTGIDIIAERFVLQAGPQRLDHEVLFTMPQITDDMRLFFEVERDDPDFWIDNVSLQQVSIKPSPASDQRFPLLVNDTAATQTISISGNHQDIFGNAVGNSVTLEPYSSQILISQDADSVALPTAPSNVVLFAQTGTQGELRWDAVGGATGYNLLYTPNASTTPQVFNLGNINLFNGDVPEGMTGLIAIQAYNSQGGGTPSALIDLSLRAPQFTWDTANNRVTWGSVSGATGYRLAYTVGSNKTTPDGVIEVDSNTTSLSLNGVAAGTYAGYVYPYNGMGQGIASNVIVVTLP